MGNRGRERRGRERSNDRMGGREGKREEREGKEGKGIVVSSACIHTNTNVFLLTHYTIYVMLFIVNLQTYTFRS